MIYFLAFLFSLHVAPTVYIISTFLTNFIDAQHIGTLYTIASVITIILFINYQKILTLLGNYKTFILTLYLVLITLILLAWAPHPYVVMGAFMANFVFVTFIFMNLDIFLEHETEEQDVGGTRGFYLTALSAAFVAGPIISAFLLKEQEYWKVFTFGIFLIIIVIAISNSKLKYFKDAPYPEIPLFIALKKIFKEHDIYYALQCSFVLRIFYAWMIIYTPIYLTQNVGFSIEATSLIIGVGLIPFVLLEMILGKIADKKIGEKEMLVAGLIIMALSTASIFFIPTTQNIILWMMIIFVTRIGASMVEVMTETYIFKKIDKDDVATLTFLRMLSPISYVIAPILGTIIIYYLDISWLFLILGAYILPNIIYAFRMKDTL